MKTRRKRQVPAQTDPPHGVPDRSLGRDMDCVGTRLFEVPLDVAGGNEREPDLRIARHRQRPELIRAEKRDFGAERLCFLRDVTQRMHDAVDLRVPCVRRDQYLHAVKRPSPAGGRAGVSVASALRAASVQVMISNWPSARSATAVQLSTQSPQLM